MRTLFVFVCLMTAAAAQTPAGALDITLKNGTAREQGIRDELQSLLAKHDLRGYIYTRELVIDEKAHPPHSHPVLTLNAANRGDHLLSTFVHEQLHWYEYEKGMPERFAAARVELSKLYPDAPSGPPEGARNLESTYLHLIICFLEAEAMRALVGEEVTAKLLRSKPFYRWVYARVLEDGEKLKAVLERHQILPLQRPAAAAAR